MPGPQALRSRYLIGEPHTVTARNNNTRMWDQFWNSGRGACCSVHDGVDYAADFSLPWVEFFADLRDSDSVLDLCTGNGAVLRTALEQSESAGVSVRLDGVDLSQIETGAPDQKITIHPQTSVTELPFGDQVFDYVTSQFGIEYTPLEDACREAIRVLKQGGQGRFVMHAKEGVTTEYAERELADLDELISDIGIFPAAADAIKLMCAAERDQSNSSEQQIAEARVAHALFHDRLATVGETWQQRSATDAYRDSGSILQHTLNNRAAFSVDVLLDKVSETEEAVALHRDRLSALVGAALSLDDCNELAQQLKALGCTTVSVNPVEGNNQKMLGWCVNLQT